MKELTVKQVQEWLKMVKGECSSVRIKHGGSIDVHYECGIAQHNLETLTETILGAQSDPAPDDNKKSVWSGPNPSWDDAPEWANWLAQDEDGDFCWYENDPIPGFSEWTFHGEESKFEHAAVGEPNPNWKRAIEKRHFEEKTVSIEEQHSEIESTLNERGNRYGDFAGHAEITQAIKRAMESSRNWETLPDDMKEALEMIAHKIGRILNGDPNYADSWHDIIGYARLVEKRLEAEHDS